MKYAQPGTVSHGTLRTEDLIDTFASVLESLADANRYTSAGDERALTELNGNIDDLLGRIERCKAEREDYYECESAEWHLNDLIELLSAFAPPGHHFSAHEGDGSDFGFWPSEEV